MGLNIWTALRAPFWKAGGFGADAYTGPALDIAADNGNQSYVLDPAGRAMYLSINAGTTRGRTHFNNPNGFSVSGKLSTVGTPTITPTGGTASTWAYKIVARASNGTAAASAAGQTTAGVATLTQAAYNTITWVAVTGAVSYDIYRTTAATSPTSTGLIGNVLATATLSFVDYGITADGSTAPTVNTTGVMEATSYFDIAVIGLAAVQNTVITTAGTAGVVTWTYKVSAVTATGSENATSSTGSTTTGNATLTSVNYNIITWKPVPGAVSYNIYRTVAGTTPSTTGLIGNVPATSSASSLTFNDTAVAISSATIPTTDTTGGITGATSFSSAGASTSGIVSNYIATESGANNAIAGALLTNGGTAVPLTAGLQVVVKLAHTLQAGGNTFNLNGGGALAIKSHFNVANDLATAYAATGVITLLYNGTLWLDMSE
jgi:hypothetical protein